MDFPERSDVMAPRGSDFPFGAILFSRPEICLSLTKIDEPRKREEERIMPKKRYVRITVCFLIILACFLGLSTQGGAQSNLEKIIGTWKLISIESVMLPSGSISYDWMGVSPLGLIIYDQIGYMSVQFMKVPRPAFSTGRYFDAPREEINRAFNDYYSTLGLMKSMKAKELLFIM